MQDRTGADDRDAVAIAAGLVSELRPRWRGEVRLESRLDQDLGLDSLSLMELRERMEDALGVSVPDETIARAVTLGDLLDAADAPRRERDEPGERAPVGEARAGAAAPDEASTLPEVLLWHASQHPDRLHLRLLGEDAVEAELSFGDLAQRAGRCATALHELGVEPGDTVALMLPTGEAYFVSFFGCVLAGAVPVPIYPPARPSQLEDHLLRHAAILRNAQVRLLVTVAEARNVARLLRAQVPSMREVVVPDDLDHGGRRTEMRPAPGDVAMLQYTSGSTASPKGVVLTHANLLSNIRAMSQAAAVDPSSDVFVSWLPLYHDMGLIGAWLGSLTMGVPLVVMSPLTFLSRPVRWMRAITEHGGTLSAAPNFAYELCCTRIRDADLEGLDLSSWRLAFNGAEPVSADTIRRFTGQFERFGFRPEAMAPVYGLAECAVGLTFPELGRPPRIDTVRREPLAASGRAEPAPSEDGDTLRIVSGGRAIAGHEIRIVGPRGRRLGEREQGTIQFRGPSATSGYHRDAEQTRRLIRDGWRDTGDLGYVAGSELFVTGRVKDLIIRGGRNLHPQEIEQAAGEVGGVRKGCVAAFAAVDEASGTERLVVVAETREAAADAREDLERRVAAAVGDVVGMPADEVVIAPPGAVLKTSSGKIRRAATRERWEAGALDRPAAPAWRQVSKVARMSVIPQARRTRRRIGAASFGVWAWLCCIAVGVPTLVLLALTPRARWRWRLVRSSARFVVRLMGTPMVGLGTDRVPEGGSVIVAPHGSPLDGPALLACLPTQPTFVVLADVAEVRFVGFLLRRIGVEFIERDDRSRAASGVDRLTESAREGKCLVIFPESTMSPLAGLRRFHMGAFVTAARAGVPVVPVGIDGTREMVGPHGRLPKPGRVRVVVGEPIRAAADGWEAAVELRDRARSALLDLLGVTDLTADP